MFTYDMTTKTIAMATRMIIMTMTTMRMTTMRNEDDEDDSDELDDDDEWLKDRAGQSAE